MQPDRYEFRITARELQYLDPISGEFRRLVRGRSQDDVREMFEENWRDICYADAAETTGTFKAFS